MIQKCKDGEIDMNGDKKSRMTHMLIDGIISKDDYEDKLSTIMRKLNNLEEKTDTLDSNHKL